MKSKIICMMGALVFCLATACVEGPSGTSNSEVNPPQDMSVMADMSPLDMGELDMPIDMDSEQDMGDMATPDLGLQDMAPQSACDPDCEGGDVCDEERAACVACLGDNDCEGDSVCELESNTCVACVDDAQCVGEDAPRCEPETNTCVACLGDSDCQGSDRCDLGTNVCVECLGDNDCTEDSAGFCELDTNTCVACLTDEACNSPQAAKCDEGNACSSCMIDDDCAHLGLARCETGTCYECLPEKEEEDCNGNACDPETFTCTNTPLGTLDSCQPCLADSECGMNQGCVELTFGSVTQGYCLVDGIAAGGCPEPYVVPHNNVTSRSGVTSDWCGINDQVTSCVAVRQRTKDYPSCMNSTTCGLPGEDDAFCVDEGIGGMVCTYACTQDRQCDQTLEECRDVAGDGVPAKVCTPL